MSYKTLFVFPNTAIVQSEENKDKRWRYPLLKGTLAWCHTGRPMRLVIEVEAVVY